MARALSFALAALVAVCAVAPPRTAQAEEVRVRVRGGSRIEAHATRTSGEIVLRGVVVDDAGQGLAGASVSARITREGAPDDAPTREAVRGAVACEGSARASVRPASEDGAVALLTDDAGRFCVRLRLDAARFLAVLAWPGTPLVVGAEERVAFDASRRALTLRFDPAPRVVSLDEAHATVEVVATIDEGGEPVQGTGLALSLTDEQGTSLGRETTDATGRVRFSFATAALGPPGRGELRVACEGNTDVAYAKESLEVERRAMVTLRVPERAGAEPAIPEDGIVVPCELSTVKGAVSEGAVEARIGDTIVGAAPVEHGVARPVLTFASPGSIVDVHLRYVPASPWLVPEGETLVRLPVARRTLSARAPLLLSGLAVLTLFLLGRARASAKKTKPTSDEPVRAGAETEPQAGIEVLASADGSARVWRGRVVDAHDRHGLGGAHVWIEHGTFSGRTIVARAEADEEGRFELVAPAEVDAGAQLGVEARLHARLMQPLPRPGELAVALVARRRALLARLVAWARHAGHPFDARPEPTPGHVRRAAMAHEDAAGAVEWAEAVEEAAFGRGEVDADAEARVDRLRPEKANVGSPPDEPR